MLHFRNKNLNCPEPVMDLNGNFSSIQVLEYKNAKNGVSAQGEHKIRLLKFVPGKLLVSIDDLKNRHFIQVGQLLWKIHNAAKVIISNFI